MTTIAEKDDPPVPLPEGMETTESEIETVIRLGHTSSSLVGEDFEARAARDLFRALAKIARLTAAWEGRVRQCLRYEEEIARLTEALAEANVDIERLHQAIHDIGKEAEGIMRERDNAVAREAAARQEERGACEACIVHCGECDCPEKSAAAIRAKDRSMTTIWRCPKCNRVHLVELKKCWFCGTSQS